MNRPSKTGCSSTGFSTLVLLLVSSLTLMQAEAASTPVCPLGSDDQFPPFGEIGDPPAFASWHGLAALVTDCRIALQSPAELVVALAGRFTRTGSVSTIAARLGAISKTQGLPYWSVTDQSWRPLITEAYALDSRGSEASRLDFTGQEILGGKTMYFVQNDSRSWGNNVYSLRVIDASADHLVLRSHNVSAVRIGPITLFRPGDVQSVLFIGRAGDSVWTYYSLAVIKHSTFAAREKSLINRQAALFRFLAGTSPDRNPPLAP